MEKATASLTLECPSPEAARRLDEATRVDHGEFCTSRVEGSSVIIDFTPATPRSLRHSIDDLLANALVAMQLDDAESE